MFSTPGVYIEEESSLTLSINTGATAVPVIVGIFRDKDGAVRSLTEGCVRVVNWMDFESKFHVAPCNARVSIDIEREDPTQRPTQARAPGDYLIDISAIDTDGNSVFALRSYFDNGGGPCYLLSVDPDENLEATDHIPEWIEEYPDISLLVLAVNETSITTDFFWQIYRAFDQLQRKDSSYFVIAHSRNAHIIDDALFTRPSQTAFYAPYVVTPYQYWRSDELVGIAGYTDGNEAEQGEVTDLAQLAARNPVLYRAICTDLDKRLAVLSIPLPPSAAVAGAYARNDRERGVWKAPANIALRSVSRLVQVIDDDEHGQLNDKGINVIRWMSDRGPVIAGARTLDVDSEAWRYIPVRRLFSAVERDLRQALRPLVFEPNSPPAWERARSAIDNHLGGLWRRGALLGDTPAQAYFVRVGKGLTMTDEDIEKGRMIIRIGMAAVRPAEFIILEFTQNMSQG